MHTRMYVMCGHTYLHMHVPTHMCICVKSLLAVGTQLNVRDVSPRVVGQRKSHGDHRASAVTQSMSGFCVIRWSGGLKTLVNMQLWVPL